MAKIKLSISDLEGKSKSVEFEGIQAQKFIGKRIGDMVEGEILGQPGMNFQIMGGSDKDGFPMRRDVHGGVKKAILISGGTGYKAKSRGVRRRKTVRGNVITDDIVQVNLKAIKTSIENQ